MSDLVTLVPPHFNQLTVFDPRLPHGVRTVEGTRDPRRSRLVLHGWFTQPAPFFQGVPHQPQIAALPRLHTRMEHLQRPKMWGCQALSLYWSPDGALALVVLLC